MTVTAQIKKETEFGFNVRIHNGDVTLGTKFVSKPVADAAPGWMARGMAKDASEAVTVALRWAGH